MSSQALLAADKVTEFLNSQSFSLPFTAERKFLPYYDLATESDLKVVVVPSSAAYEEATRGQTGVDFSVDIGIQKRLYTPTLEEDAGALMDLVQEVLDALRATRVFGEFTMVALENDPVFAPDHIDEHRLFTSLIRVFVRRYL